MEYEFARRPEPQPTEVERSRARLAQAARVLLKDVPYHAQNFGFAAVMLMGEPNGDATIAGMIEFTITLAQKGHRKAAEEIERGSGIQVEIVPSQVPVHQVAIERVDPRDRIQGYLVGLLGTDRMLQTQTPYIQGIAMVEDRRGRERFIPVGVLENGTVFSIF